MEFENTNTSGILYQALKAELLASFRYRMFAEAARKEGMKQVADIFDATAQNESEHASHIFSFLGGLGITITNIEQSIQNELMEATSFYPDASKTADKEGFHEIAEFFRRMSEVEAKHERNFRDLLSDSKSGNDLAGRTVGHSAVEMAQVMLPVHANPAGFVHGGELLKLMDTAVGVVAARHSGGNAVTGHVDDITFHHRVTVGTLAIVRAKITFSSRSSMEIQAEMDTEEYHLGTGEKLPALGAIFTMVAIDSNGKARNVPPIIITTEEEHKLFAIGQKRYRLRKKELGIH